MNCSKLDCRVAACVLLAGGCTLATAQEVHIRNKAGQGVERCFTCTLSTEAPAGEGSEPKMKASILLDPAPAETKETKGKPVCFKVGGVWLTLQ